MSFRSVMTVWDGHEDSKGALEAALRLAKRENGHLDILCLGVDRVPTGFYAADMAHEMAHDFYGQAVKEAETLADEARGLAAKEDVGWTVRVAALRWAELPDQVGKAAWFQDIVVLPKPFQREDEELAEAVVDAALFESLSPLLIVPPGGAESIGDKVLIAWNGSAEAMRAIRAAMPILQQASLVEVAMIDPARHPADEADPGRSLAQMLSRHDVHVELSVLARTTPTVADTLLKRAGDIDADLLVMGGYGHSRFRERLLGGATRGILKSAEIPVLMAH